jgi:hypothetical protein
MAIAKVSRARARMDCFPSWLRVRYAAEGWSNRIGHAEFGSGQLAAILGYDPETPNARSGTSRAIAHAKAHGLIAPESDVRCLVLPLGDRRKSGRSGDYCREHRIITAEIDVFAVSTD